MGPIQANEIYAELVSRNYSRAFYHIPLPHVHVPHYPPLPHIPVVHHEPHLPVIEEKNWTLYIILGIGAFLLLSDEEEKIPEEEVTEEEAEEGEIE